MSPERNFESREALPTIEHTIQEARGKIREDPFLRFLESGEATLPTWRRFAVERYHAAEPFVPLLKAAQVKARDGGYASIADELQQNEYDERGVEREADQKTPKRGENGNLVVSMDKDHETWRQWFYNALGVNKNDLQGEPCDSSKEYSEAVYELINNGDAFLLSGALLYLEAIIPTEFERIREGLWNNLELRQIFFRREKLEHPPKQELLYIADHIKHDAEAHYVDLQDAIGEYAKDGANYSRVMEGIQKMREIKEQYLTNLNQTIRNVES